MERTTSARAGTVDDYKLQLLQCQTSTREFYRNEQKGIQGRFQNAMTNSNTIRDRVKQHWDVCVSKVLAMRTAQTKAYDLAMAKGNREINLLNTQITAMREQLTQLKGNIAQSAIDRANQMSKEAYNQSLEEFMKTKQLGEMAQMQQQKAMMMQQNLQKAQSALTDANNDLFDLEKEKPLNGSKSVKEKLNDALAAYRTNRDCETPCKGTPSEGQCKSDRDKLQKDLNSSLGGAK
jgi:hypothetical protein